MKNDQFKREIGKILKNSGFLYEGGFWVKRLGEIDHVLTIDRSNYSNSFYLRFGIRVTALKGIDSSGIDVPHNVDLSPGNTGLKLSQQLFNLEFPMNPDKRMASISSLINQKVYPFFANFNNENDVRNHLLQLSNYNMIPLYVRTYFGLNKAE